MLQRGVHVLLFIKERAIDRSHKWLLVCAVSRTLRNLLLFRFLHLVPWPFVDSVLRASNMLLDVEEEAFNIHREHLINLIENVSRRFLAARARKINQKQTTMLLKFVSGSFLSHR